MHHHPLNSAKSTPPAILSSELSAGEGSSAGDAPVQKRGVPSPPLGPRRLPELIPDRIEFGSRLVLVKKAQTADMVLYLTHIKGKPTFIFVMGKLDPATAIEWRGAFKNRKGIILCDRDGVVKDSRFLDDAGKESAAEVMIPSALRAAKRAHEANIGLGIVTNQGGYQSGRMSFADTVAINVRVVQQIANAGGRVDAVFICPFTAALDGDGAGIYDARKPAPGMFLYASKLAAAHGIPVIASTGDQRTDGAAAQSAGQRFFAITGPSGRWQAEVVSARQRDERLPELNIDPECYREVHEFADVVEDVLTNCGGD